MKFLLVLGVVLFGVWLWKHNRKAAKLARDAAQPRPATTPPAPAPAPAHMVACSHCGLHLPQHEAVNGKRGIYCCDAHRTADEG
jgi:uncharacterized protein